MAAARREGDGARRPPKGERRRNLVARAKQLFAERGYEAVSLEDIAKAAGVSPAQLLRSFPDKPALLRAVAEDFHAAAFTPTPEEPDAPPDPLARLYRTVEQVLTAAGGPAGLEFRALLRVLAEADDQAPGVGEVLSEVLSESVSVLAEVVKAGQQAGVFRRPLDPRAAGWELLRALMGYLLLRPLAGPIPSPADTPGAFLDGFLHGIVKTDV
jgi:AcrR family transcriptional regulator